MTHHRPDPGGWRRWLLPILLVAFLWMLIAQRAELSQLARTLSAGRWPWIVLAAALQVAYYLLYAELCRSALTTAGAGTRLSEALPVLLGSMFVNVVVPSAGAAGAALWMDDAARRGRSPARAAAGLVLVMGMIFVALGALLLASLAVLAARGELRGAEVAGTAALLAMTAGMAALLALGAWRPRRLAGVLGGVERAAARLRLGALLPAGWAGHTADEFTAAAGALRARPTSLVRLLAVATGMTALDLASLAVLFPAFGQAMHAGALVTGYALGILAWILSPVPQGIGVVEGVMTLVYASLGVPTAAAAVIVIAFRGLTFWLPMAAGALLLRRLRSLRVEA